MAETHHLQQELARAKERIKELEDQQTSFVCPADKTLRQLVFEDAPGGMAVVTLKGKIPVCNQEAAAMLGYTPEEIIELDVRDILRNKKNRHSFIERLNRGETIANLETRLSRKDMTPIWVNFNAKMVTHDGEQAALVSFTDVTDHRLALNHLELDEIRFEMLYTISDMIHRPEKEILDFALDAIVKVSASDIGYIFKVSEDESELLLHSWSDKVMKKCQAGQFPSKYKTDESGLWAESIRQRQPVITNDYQNDPGRRGTPSGHIPIYRHMNIPVFEGEDIVYLAGVGNKEEEYNEEDVRQLKLVMDGTLLVLQRKRAIIAMEHAQEELEQKIQDRTAKLQQANEDFARLTARLIRQDKERTKAQKTLVLYERIISSSPDHIALINADFRIKMVNASYLRAHETRNEDVLGKHLEEVSPPGDFTLIRPYVERALAGETVEMEHWVNYPGAGTQYMSITYHPVPGDNGSIDYVSVESRDMTDHKRNEQALQETADRLDLATNAGNIGIWEWDLLEDETHWDHLMFQLYQVRPGEFPTIHKAWSSRLHPDDLVEVERQLASCIEERKRFETEFRIVWPDGSTRFLRAAGNLRIDPSGTPEAMIGVNWDVTERRTMENELRRLASTDPLTGAANRRQFMTRLEKEFERCRRYDTPMVLLSLDIDHFKDVNDTYGHPTGDEVLKDLVERCLSTLRTTDVFGRVGGEEFLAALTQTNSKAGYRTAERLRHAIEEIPLKCEDQTISYTISIGLTQLTPDDDSIEVLLKRADEALYKAKNNGRNRVEIL